MREEGTKDKATEKRNEKIRLGNRIPERMLVIILGVLANLLYLIKDLGMVVILATILIWMGNGVKSGLKHGWKESGTVCIWRKLVLYVCTIFLAELLSQPVFHRLIPEMEVRLLGATSLRSVLFMHSDIQRLSITSSLKVLGTLLQYMATYFTQFVLLTGILPVLAALSGYFSNKGDGFIPHGEKVLFQLAISCLRLLIPDEGMSMAVSECYLNLDYYVCPKAGFTQYQGTEERQEDSLPVLSVTTYFQKEDLPAMRYLIAEDELAVDGYERVSLLLDKYVFYSKRLIFQRRDNAMFFHHNDSQEMRTNCEKQAFYYTMELPMIKAEHIHERFIAANDKAGFRKAVKMFFRYACRYGLIENDISHWIPSVPRHKPVPSALSTQGIHALCPELLHGSA